jgi:hypothetical protein
MRRRRSKAAEYAIKKPYLYLSIALLLTFIVTLNCSLGAGSKNTPNAKVDDQILSGPAANSNGDLLSDLVDPQAAVLAEQLWADAADSIPSTPRPGQSSGSTVSLDVRDANILDVLSLLAYKIGVNIIYLEQPIRITFKSESLSPITTLELILQNQGFDYLVVGRNYVVAQRERLFSNFTERLMLTRYGLFYVSASSMQNYLSQLGVDARSLNVDSNQQALWLQGTPMTLGMARELINALDVMENADFAVGGLRKIRLPVAYAEGSRADEELEALIDLLSILLDGFRDGRTDMDWLFWDHPDPVPSIFMDWESPIIKPYDIKMKITRNFTGDSQNQIRYLIAEGTPANIRLVEEMIFKIQDVKSGQESPLSFPDLNDSAETEITYETQWVPPSTQQIPVITTSYYLSLNAVPQEGGTLSGAGSYSSGSTVTIRANPAEGYEFVRWIEAGAERSTSETYSFSLYNDRTLEAVFISSSGEEE